MPYFDFLTRLMSNHSSQNNYRIIENLTCNVCFQNEYILCRVVPRSPDETESTRLTCKKCGNTYIIS